MIEVRNSVQAIFAEVQECRRHLHQYPEIQLETPQTKAYIIDKLKTYGDYIIDEQWLTHSVVARLVISEQYETIAFRADMDALPMQEESKVAYASKLAGKAHACGHDGHMAALLGLAKYLVQHKQALTCNILLLFQPGEESPGGAQLMIEAGLFQKYPCKCIIGMHLMSDIDAGKIACCSGAMMARNGEVDIEVHGQSAHAAMPHLGNDAIVAASALLMQLQTITSRSIDPLQRTLLTIGKMVGGQARNVLCDHVSMQGTLRAFHDEHYERLKQRIEQVCVGVEKSFDVKVHSRLQDCYPVLENDVALYDALTQVAQADCLLQEPKMIAEDFSFYQKIMPGLFYYTGVRDTQHTKGIHDCCFDFDERCLLYAIEINIRLLTKLEGLK